MERSALEVQRFEDILAVRNGAHMVAFHARDLEVAEIDNGVWQTIEGNNTSLSQASGEEASSEIQEELISWLNQAETSGVETADPAYQTLLINVTQICNLRCGYCAASGDGSYGQPIKKIDLLPTFEQIDFTLEKMSKSDSRGHLHIEFFGGEPLLFPDIIRMIAQYATLATSHSPHQVSFKIVSNGTMASDDVLEMLKCIKPTLQISIDGPAELNDLQRVNRAGKGVTGQIEKNLKIFSQIADELNGLELNAVFDKNNVEVLKTWEYFCDLPVDRFHFEFSLTELDETANLEFCRQMEIVAERAFAKGGREELLRIKRFDVDFRRLDRRQKVVNFCGAGKSFHAIDAQNQIFSCPWDISDSGERMGRHTQLRPDKVKFYENPIVNKSDCSDCWARFLCGGGCMFSHKSATGSKTQVNSVFCTRTRSLSALSILWYAQSRSFDRRNHEAH